MTDLREIATAAADEARADEQVLAVLLTGSLARGDETPSSDVDLIVVTNTDGDFTGMRRRFVDGVLVETVTRSAAGWRERFARPSPRWVYAFLEAKTLYDAGVASELVADAAAACDQYRTPMSVLEELAVGFWHGQAKLERSLASAEPARRGYQASVAVDWIIDGLFAVHDKPLPAASRRLHYLTALRLEPEVERLWAAVVTGNTDERLDAAAALIGWLRRRLPEPNLLA